MSKPQPLYDLVRGYARSLVKVQYRRYRYGTEIPSEGPLMLFCNHNNGLADGALQFHLTRRRLRILAKFSLFEIFGLGSMVRALGAIPVYRQKDMVDTSMNIGSFAAIREALAEGGAIMLFPEGESEFSHKLRSFKTGISRMALGAEDVLEFKCGVQLTPVGIAYDEPYAYRSKAHMWVGETITIEDYAEMYVTDGRLAVRRLVKKLAAAQRAITIELDEASDHVPVILAEELLPADGRHLPMRRKDLATRLGYLRAQDPERAGELTSGLHSLASELKARALTSADLEEPVSLPLELARGLGGALVLLLLVPVLALVGPPYLLGRTRAHREANPPDKRATITLLLSTLTLGLWAVALPLTVGLAYGSKAGWITAAAYALACLSVAPLWENRQELRRAISKLSAGRMRKQLTLKAELLRTSVVGLAQVQEPSAD
ncbi:MAG: glycerol-3-phosphate O-acyltransferase/dihydroxyacetone phosphate acyltransferase [Planctomycetota bacterium]|jgi:glycerol-3-phosphate O-acyltransferase/dihydroxyacetone phosphate acyltransferase